MQNRAYSILDIKSLNDGERLIEGIASTPSPDRMGDIVDPMGATFALPMPLLWQHNHDEPIGHVEFAKPTKNGIPFKARIAKVDEAGVLKERLDEAWQSIKAGLVRAVSIGFRPLEYSFIEGGGVHFKQWEWLELSAVTIPAQSEALITAIKSFDAEHRAAAPVDPVILPESRDEAALGREVHVAKLNPPARARAFVINRINHLR